MSSMGEKMMDECSGGWGLRFNSAQHVNLDLFFARIIGQDKNAGVDHGFVKTR
jgi:hypothetical protein